jgi:hypothetical protein
MVRSRTIRASIGRIRRSPASHAAKAISELIELGKLFETTDGRLFNQFARDNELGDRAGLSVKSARPGLERWEVRGSRVSRKRGPEWKKRGSEWKQPEARKVSEETAENGQSEKANAFYARAREEKRREERIPPTPQTRGKEDGDGQKPGADKPPSRPGEAPTRGGRRCRTSPTSMTAPCSG